MKLESKNKLFETLVVLLVLVVAAQSVVMFNLYQRGEAATLQADAEPFALDLVPRAGAAQPPSIGSPSLIPPLSTTPYGGLGLDPDLWDPLKELRSMRQQMDQMFDDSFSRFRQAPDFEAMWGGTFFSPSMDLEEQDELYIVRMDIPGTDKSNISVEVDDRKLTVSGHVEKTLEPQGANHLRKERHSGKFKRTFTLPGPVKADEMKAEYKKGVLIITLPKGVAEEGASQTITVQ